MATAKKSSAASKKSDAKNESEVEEVEAPKGKTFRPEQSNTKDLSVEDVVKEIQEGKWNSGRERDDRLRAAGYDTVEVHKELAKQLSER